MNEGKCLGLIGGLGVGATILYYQELVKAHTTREAVPNFLIIHADVNRVLKHAVARETAQLADYLAQLLRRLSQGGAEVGVIPAVTPHICAIELSQRSPIPLVNLVTVIAQGIHERGFKRVALFGTRFTIETRMFGQLTGVEVVTPKAHEIDFIHQIYLEIVSAGRGNEEQRRGLRQLAHTIMERDQVEAIVFAGTELALLFDESNTDFAHVDGARLHWNAIMQELFANQT
jgi:aspartate racemase